MIERSGRGFGSATGSRRSSVTVWRVVGGGNETVEAAMESAKGLEMAWAMYLESDCGLGWSIRTGLSSNVGRGCPFTPGSRKMASNISFLKSASEVDVS